jgi:hypothetical protein
MNASLLATIANKNGTAGNVDKFIDLDHNWD